MRAQTIQKDAIQILNFIYEQYVTKHKLVGMTELLELDQFENGEQIDRAIKYLRDEGFIDIVLLMGNTNGLQNFILKKINPSGIREAESR